MRASRPRAIETLVPGGLFGNSALRIPIDLLFASGAAEFKQTGSQKKDGHKTFPLRSARRRLKRASSECGGEGRKLWLGYGCSVGGSETLDVVRVDFRVNRIPNAIGVTLIQESMHDKRVPVGKSEFNLPDHSELSATDVTGTYSLNMIKLSGCRELAAESTVKYGAPVQGTASREKQDQR